MHPVFLRNIISFLFISKPKKNTRPNNMDPSLWHQDIDGCEDAEDVEAACFEFHLEHFSELAGIKVWWVDGV